MSTKCTGILSSLKRKTLSLATTWMHLEGIIQSEISQKLKEKILHSLTDM
jgi:hypothetical protein